MAPVTKQSFSEMVRADKRIAGFRKGHFSKLSKLAVLGSILLFYLCDGPRAMRAFVGFGRVTGMPIVDSSPLYSGAEAYPSRVPIDLVVRSDAAALSVPAGPLRNLLYMLAKWPANRGGEIVQAMVEQEVVRLWCFLQELPAA